MIILAHICFLPSEIFTNLTYFSFLNLPSHNCSFVVAKYWFIYSIHAPRKSS